MFQFEGLSEANARRYDGLFSSLNESIFLEATTMNAADHINQWLDANNITEIECLVPDMSGTARGKIIPRHKYNPAEGIRMAEAVFTQTVTGDYPEEEFASVTDSDMRLLPDPSSLRLVPWAKDPSAAMASPLRLPHAMC